ncbi:hypothetical protein [Streptomyces sp. MH13]|uniref:hypothetical protein n=1 Tax=unclassified Streptomyces TaxID=2593676 RepID=UPI003CF31EA0
MAFVLGVIGPAGLIGPAVEGLFHLFVVGVVVLVADLVLAGVPIGRTPGTPRTPSAHAGRTPGADRRPFRRRHTAGGRPVLLHHRAGSSRRAPRR